MQNYSRFLWFGLLAALVAIVLLVAPGAARPVYAAGTAVVIDHFEIQQDITATIPSPVISQTLGGLADPSIIGSSRKLWLNFYGNSGGGSPQITANANTPFSQFSYNPDNNSRGQVRITWDGSTNGSDPLALNFNLSANFSALPYVVVANEHNSWTSTLYTLTLYTDAGNYSVYKPMHIPSQANNTTLPNALFFRLAAPFSATGAGVTLSNVKAIVFEIDSNGVDGALSRIRYIEATEADFGDLPTAYKVSFESITTLAGSPSSLQAAVNSYDPNLYLGTNWDGEADGTNSATAFYDDNHGVAFPNGDEDGVHLGSSSVWAPSNVVSLTVQVVGDGCLSGWVDWLDKGGFLQVTDAVVTNTLVTTGTYTINPTFPSGGAGGSAPYTRFARFRLFPRTSGGTCPSASTPLPFTGEYLGGETEDYLFGSNPTAVTLTNLSANADSNNWVFPVAGGAVLALGTLGVAVLRRRRAR